MAAWLLGAGAASATVIVSISAPEWMYQVNGYTALLQPIYKRDSKISASEWHTFQPVNAIFNSLIYEYAFVEEDISGFWTDETLRNLFDDGYNDENYIRKHMEMYQYRVGTPISFRYLFDYTQYNPVTGDLFILKSGVSCVNWWPDQSCEYGTSWGFELKSSGSGYYISHWDDVGGWYDYYSKKDIYVVLTDQYGSPITSVPTPLRA